MKISRKSSDNNPPAQDSVAIVGMSLRVPGANTLEQFWRNLVDGKDCLSRLSRAELEQKGISPSELSDPSVISAKPEIQEVEYFDADFFGFSSTQAELSDPAHRLFLQCAWEAMEHAGIAPGDSKESTGVFAGVEGNYLKSNLKYIEINNPATGIALRIGNSIDYVNLRVSHELNLVGPSYTTMATCSTSLAAVHLAVQSLQSGECDTAIAGGSKLELPNNGIYRSGVDGMLSASGTIRPFDARGDGTIFGSGVGVVVLKTLETAIRDGNPIYSVILGSAFCNDGKPEDKKSFIAPAPSGQQRAIARALERAKIDPRTIGMVECHGTGTLLGDPTEVTSLTNVYRQSTHDRSYCALGSVKANVGHLGSAAGVVSLIKSCMAINKGIIPPLANFEQPNPEINFSASPFYINTEIVPWNNDNHPRRAGVSAFGFGGANAHLILGEYQQDSVTKITQPVSQHLFVVSAKNPQALQRIKQNLAQYLEEYPDIPLSNIAHTLQMGRQAMSHRDYLIASDNHRPSLIKNLRGIDSRATPCSSDRRLVFLYPGQGSQVPGMGQSLYAREAVFRDTIDYCSDLLMDEIGFDLRKKMFIQENASLEAAQESLRQTAVSQPALFVVEYALSKLYAHWGAEPDIMLGHSLGELVAACLAGVFSIDDGLRMVAIRSRMMQACQPGSMLAVLLPLEKLVDLLPSELDLAAENGPSSNVVSGDTATVQAFSSELESRGISNRLLATSHAFHSRMMDENFDEYCQELEKFNFHPPQTCIISNVTGQPMTNEQALNPRYWAEQRRNPVKFSKALVQILSEGDPVFLEVGPGKVLSGLVEQHDAKIKAVTTLFENSDKLKHSSNKQSAPASEQNTELEALGKIWSLGADIDWSKFYPGESARKVSLPTYPFQQKYFWADSKIEAGDTNFNYPLHLYEPGWVKSNLDGDVERNYSGTWLIFSDKGNVALHCIERLNQNASSVTVIEPGDQFEQLSDQHYRILPGSRDHIDAILKNYSLIEGEALNVLHFWVLGVLGDEVSDFEKLQIHNKMGFATLLVLTQSIFASGFASHTEIKVVTSGIADVDTRVDRLQPTKAAILGPCMLAPQEIPGLEMRCIDVPMGIENQTVDFLLDAVFNEIGFRCKNTITALRDDGRFAQELFELPEISHSRPRLRFSGTVLITGGVGGLGLKVAEHLFETLKVRLVLTSRWQPPPQDEWPTFRSENSRINRALTTLSRLIERGAEILVVRADASRMDEMQNVVAQANKKFGRIHGVVHAAGSLDDGPLLQKTIDSAFGVFNSKVNSALVLESLFKEKPLDMFVHFSSQASIHPAKGQVDYAGANAILDRLAKLRHQTHSGISCAMGWGPWRDTGMAWEYTGSNIESISLFKNKDGVKLSDPVHEAAHPILKSYRKYEDGDILFYGSIENGGHWIASDHLIDGRPVVSGTTIMELFHRGHFELNPTRKGFEISKMVIFQPYVVDASTEFELLICKVEKNYRAELRSRVTGTKSNWIVISSANLSEAQNPPEIEPDIEKKLLTIRDKPNSRFEVHWHGPRWQCEGYLAVDGNNAFAKVRMQDQFHEETKDYGMHPAIFDRTIHSITEHIHGIALPYTCQSIRIFRQVPAEVLVYGFCDSPGSEITERLLMLDMNGNLIAEIKGYIQRKFLRKGMEVWNGRKDGQSAGSSWIMEPQKKGVFDSFSARDVTLPSLHPDQVSIETKAAGLNFRDVLSVLGQLPEGDPSKDMIGSECSGIVKQVGENVKHVKPGDRVVALANDCFASTVITNGHSVTYLPENLNFVEGASIPITYMTVEYALGRLSKLQPGERILIHAATGGIGLAAVQLAQSIGAEIFATAGSEQKRSYLTNQGIAHVMDSRSLSFVEEVKESTNGEGVDVVLNALAGEFIPASMSLLRPFGRFIEIGKRDIYADSKMGLFPFRNNISYFGVDLGQLGKYRPAELQEHFEKLMVRFATGELHPSPIKEFSVDEIGKGFEYMAQTRHIGKIVFSMENNPEAHAESLKRFRSRYGTGIAVKDGLNVFSRLISSDQCPACVTAVASRISGTDLLTRYVKNTDLVRPVDTPFRAPSNFCEERLKHIWEKNLGISPIGIDDDYQELGGDSLNAIMVQVAIEEEFSIDLSMSLLFEYPTISQLGAMINEVHSIGSD